jgi:hypothetical protein
VQSLYAALSSLVIDRLQPQTLAVLVGYKPFISTDAGVTWAPLQQPPMPWVSELLFDPHRAGVLFARGFDVQGMTVYSNRPTAERHGSV